MRKPGTEPFMPVSRIDMAAHYVFDELRSDRHLRGLPRSRFVERLAHHYDAVNYLHPFREGNGRTQRVFWSRVARDAGRQLDWRLVSADRNNAASQAARERGGLAPLRQMFDDIVTSAPRLRRPASNALDVARLAFAQPATEATRSLPGQPTAGRRPPPQAPRPTDFLGLETER